MKANKLTYSSSDIVKAIRVGDPMGEVDAIYKHEFPKVKAYVMKNKGDEQDAMDVFQESLIQLFRYIKQDKFDEKYSVGAFLFSVARNEWRQKNRSKYSFVEFEDTHGEQYEEDLYEVEVKKPSVSTKQIITELLDSLGENCKRILSEVIFLKTPLKVIAEKLGYSDASVVKTRHYKCKQRLIKAFDKNPEYLKTLRNGVSF